MIGRILRATLKKKWYDMIESGEKPEEYREIKPYWISRLVDEMRGCEEGAPFSFEYAGYWWQMQTPQAYDAIEFTNGYGKHRPSMIWMIRDIVDGTGQEKWGAVPGKEYFIIKLGERIYKPHNK